MLHVQFFGFQTVLLQLVCRHSNFCRQHSHFPPVLHGCRFWLAGMSLIPSLLLALLHCTMLWAGLLLAPSSMRALLLE
jgi:hypothetical protein